MRYTILNVTGPIDVHNRLEFASTEQLRERFPSVSDHDSEAEAMRAVRALYPDAVVMPIPIALGAGETTILGVLASIHAPHNDLNRVPFVLLVQATTTNGSERQLVKNKKQWTREVWRVPVKTSKGDMEPVAVEVRFHDLDQPMKVTGHLFKRGDNGHTVLYIDTGHGAMSVELLAERVAGFMV